MFSFVCICKTNQLVIISWCHLANTHKRRAVAIWSQTRDSKRRLTNKLPALCAFTQGRQLISNWLTEWGEESLLIHPSESARFEQQQQQQQVTALTLYKENQEPGFPCSCGGNRRLWVARARADVEAPNVAAANNSKRNSICGSNDSATSITRTSSFFNASHFVWWQGSDAR